MLLRKLLPLVLAVGFVYGQCDIYGPAVRECSVDYNQRALAQTLHGPMPVSGTGMQRWTNDVNSTVFLLNVAEAAPR